MDCIAFFFCRFQGSIGVAWNGGIFPSPWSWSSQVCLLLVNVLERSSLDPCYINMNMNVNVNVGINVDRDGKDHDPQDSAKCPAPARIQPVLRAATEAREGRA